MLSSFDDVFQLSSCTPTPRKILQLYLASNKQPVFNPVISDNLYLDEGEPGKKEKGSITCLVRVPIEFSAFKCELNDFVYLFIGERFRTD